MNHPFHVPASSRARLSGPSRNRRRRLTRPVAPAGARRQVSQSDLGWAFLGVASASISARQYGQHRIRRSIAKSEPADSTSDSRLAPQLGQRKAKAWANAIVTKETAKPVR